MCAPAFLVTEVGWKMHSEYLTLLEDAIRQPDLAKSMQRYQLAVHIAKVHLNLAARRSIADALLNGDWYRENSYIQQQAEVNKPKKKKRSCASWKAVLQKLTHQTVTYLIPFTRKQWNWENKKKKRSPSLSPLLPPQLLQPPDDITQVCLEALRVEFVEPIH